MSTLKPLDEIFEEGSEELRFAAVCLRQIHPDNTDFYKWQLYQREDGGYRSVANGGSMLGASVRDLPDERKAVVDTLLKEGYLTSTNEEINDYYAGGNMTAQIHISKAGLHTYSLAHLKEMAPPVPHPTVSHLTFQK